MHTAIQYYLTCHPPLQSVCEFLQCSSSCGDGFRTRNVVCRDAHNLPSSTCDPRLLPADTKVCEEPDPCPTSPTTTTEVTTSRETEPEPIVPTVSPRSNSTSSLKMSPIDESEKKSDLSSPMSVSLVDFDPDSDYLEGELFSYVRLNSSSFPSTLTPLKLFPCSSKSDLASEELPREHTLPLIQPYMDNAVLYDQNAIPSEPT